MDTSGYISQAHPHPMVLLLGDLPKLEIEKQFADSNGVCLLYEMNYREPPVTTLVCGWCHVNDYGKISSLRFVLDPRPLFQSCSA